MDVLEHLLAAAALLYGNPLLDGNTPRRELWLSLGCGAIFILYPTVLSSRPASEALMQAACFMLQPAVHLATRWPELSAWPSNCQAFLAGS